MVVKLSVNLNAVAYLRNRRGSSWPDISHVGRLALDAGASGLTVHPRPDERHIKCADVAILADLLREYPDREYNLEGYPDERFLDLVTLYKPHQVTLVPDRPGQITSDHGWDVLLHGKMLASVVENLKALQLRVSLFCDADADMALRAADTGVDRIELYTGPYSMAYHGATADRVQCELRKLAAAAEAARSVSLGVNAGHDLTLSNIPPLLRHIPFLQEVSIGHCMIADALLYGISDAVKRYCRVLGRDPFSAGTFQDMR